MRLVLVCLFFLFGSSLARRKSQAHRAFEENEGVDWGFEVEEEENEQESSDGKDGKPVTETTKSTTTTGITTTTSTTIPATTTEDAVDELVRQMLEGSVDLANLTKLVEKEHLKSLEDGNRTILWIDAYYKAENLEMNITTIQECKAWNQHWNITVEDAIKENNNSTDKKEDEEEKPVKLTEDEMKKYLKDSEVIDSKKRLKKLGLNQDLLDEYEAIGIVFREICAGHNRILWFNSTEDAKKLGIDETSPICEPFKEDLNPDQDVLLKMAETLNDLIDANHYAQAKGLVDPPDKKNPIGERKKEHSGERKYVEYVDEEEDNRRRQEQRKEVPREGPVKVEEGGNIPPEQIDRVVNSLDYEGGVTPEPRLKTSGMQPQLKTTKTVKTQDGDTLHFVEERKLDDGNSEKDLESNDIASDEDSEDWEKEEEKEREKEEEKERHPPKKLDNIKEESRDYIPEIKAYDDDIYDYKDFVNRFKTPKKKIRTGYHKRRFRRMAETGGSVEDDWVDPVDTKPKDEATTAAPEAKNRTVGPVEIDVSDEINPVLLLSSYEAISGLGMNAGEELFERHEKLGLYLPGICADYVPKAVDSFNSSSFEGVEIEGPIGVNISALEAAGVNLTELAEKLRNDSEVDDILSRTAGSIKTLGGSFILPVLNKNQYDPFSAPIVFRGSAVSVRFGIYIESMSNFQTTTMDYDMDIYLLMAWRDARLVNPYDKPILVKEEEILEKLWRPDPFFANAKEAEFHEVTFLNFLMRIFPDGLVLYETRVKITPSCNLILCKYPHDKQTCDLLIKSFAYPVETVRFEWFSNRNHAIDKNPHVKLPELYIASYETTTCDKSRKSGTFSCLRAVFKLKRDVGFHLAQTYIPTSLALMFSWVGVWLPEEFMEGRIGVAITVLLTLSTESAGAREHLPSVSYLKAIDLWFGFITGFVFITLLQTLFVIGFDKKSSQMRKAALKKKSDITEEMREEMLHKAKRYHKIGRKLDNFCRVFYPLCFIIFLILYYFVYTEGRQDDCLTRSSSFDI